MQLCVAGIGNSWASDDGVGPAVVNRLQQLYKGKPPGHVSFETIPYADVRLLDLMSLCDTLILVDAVVSGKLPGTVHKEVWQPALLASRGVERASSHGFGVREVLDLAAELGKLPERVILWGVEIVSTQPGTALSPAVEAAIPAIVDQLHRELQNLAWQT